MLPLSRVLQAVADDECHSHDLVCLRQQHVGDGVAACHGGDAELPTPVAQQRRAVLSLQKLTGDESQFACLCCASGDGAARHGGDAQVATPVAQPATRIYCQKSCRHARDFKGRSMRQKAFWTALPPNMLARPAAAVLRRSMSPFSPLWHANHAGALTATLQPTPRQPKLRRRWRFPPITRIPAPVGSRNVQHSPQCSSRSIAQPGAGCMALTMTGRGFPWQTMGGGFCRFAGKERTL